MFDVARDDGTWQLNDDSCQPSGSGSQSMCTTWTDPEFDASLPAYYYARILEQPTCRWSAFACDALAEDERPDTCSDPVMSRIIRERAWTSPIWYQP